MENQEKVNVTAFVRNPKIHSSKLGDELILFDQSQGLYFGANQVAAHIWAYLETPKTEVELVAYLSDVFEVSAEECRNDLQKFVRQAMEVGIVTEAIPSDM